MIDVDNYLGDLARSTMAATSLCYHGGRSRSATVHLTRGVVIDGKPRTFCNILAGPPVSALFLSGHAPFCQRCVGPKQVAVASGVVAFVAWIVDGPASREQARSGK